MGISLKKITWRNIGYTLMSFIIVITLLITTHWGNRLIISSIKDNLPGLDIELESGSLLFSPHFSTIGYANNDVIVGIKDANLNWNLACLWQSKVCVDQLTVQQLSITVLTANIPDESVSQLDQTSIDHTPLAFNIDSTIDLGVDILIDNVIANSIDVKYEHLDIALTHVHTSLELITNNLDINPLKIASITINDNDNDASNTVGLAVVTTVVANPASKSINLSTFDMNAQVIKFQQAIEQLAFPTLPINITLEKSVINYLNYHSNNNNIDIQNISAAFTQKKQQINALTVSGVYLNNALKFKGNLSLVSDFPHQLMVAIDTNHPLIGNNRIKLNSSGSLKKLALTGNSTGDFETNITGELLLTQSNIPLTIAMSWQAMTLKLIALDLDAGHLSLAGNLVDYTLDLETGAKHQDLPKLTGRLNAHGSASQLVIDEANVKILNGDVSLNGLLSWDNGLSITSQLEMTKIQPHAFWPNYQGQISGRVKVNVINAVDSTYWQTSFTNIAMSGLWLDRDLTLSGDVIGSDITTMAKQTTWGQWQVDNLVLIHAQNKLSINGVIAEQASLVADISINNIGATLPIFSLEKSGQVNGQLSVTGPINELTLGASFTAKHIQSKQKSLSFEHATIAATAVLSDALPFNIKVIATALAFTDSLPNKTNQQVALTTTIPSNEQTQKLTNKFILSFSGNKANHVLDATLTSSELNAMAKISGELLSSQWRGTLSDAHISANQQHLALASPFAILANLNDESLNLSEHCWLSTVSGQSLNGSLCLVSPFTIDTQLVRSNEAIINLDKFSMTQLQPYLPREHVVSGDVNGSLSFQLFSADELSLSSNIQWINGLIETDFGDSMVSHEITELTVNAAIDRRLANVIAHLSSPTLGIIDISMVSNIFNEQPFVSGHIKSYGLELAPYRPFLKYVSQLDGKLSVSAGFSGDLNQQQIFGQLTSNNIAIASEKLPSRIDNLNAQLSLNGASATLDSSFNLASGHGALKGSLDWKEKLLATLSLTGNALALSPSKGVDLIFSPNLNLTLTPELATIRGHVNVDSANIKIESLPQSSVGLSRDVVIKQQIDKKRAIPVDININALLGEHLTVEAFGLKSTVKGALNIVQNNTQPLSTYGQLTLKNAKYKALGQNLTIEQGQIIFTGSVVNPIINIKAIRDPKETNDNVIAGVYVNGAVDKPALTVFSIPAMDQQEAISYLIYGYKSGEGEDFGQDMAISMIVNSGLGGASKMIGNLGSAVGIDNLNVTTSGSGDATRVEFSGSIGPRLQLRYGVGVFDALPEVGLRYQVNQRLFVEFINNTNQALDLLYQFSFD